MSAGNVQGGSNIYEMDRRYYAVTSAAGLFRDTLDGQSYTLGLTRTDTTTKTTATTLNDEGAVTATTVTEKSLNAAGDAVNVKVNGVNQDTESPVEPYIPTYSSTFKYEDTDITEITGLLDAAAFYYVFGREFAADPDTHRIICSGDDWGAATGAHEKEWTLTVTPQYEGALPVKVTAKLQKDGSMLLSYVNADAVGDGATADPFTLTLTLKATVNETGPTSNSSTTTGTQTEGNTVTTTETTTTTKTRTTTITWHVQAVER